MRVDITYGKTVEGVVGAIGRIGNSQIAVVALVARRENVNDAQRLAVIDSIKDYILTVNLPTVRPFSVETPAVIDDIGDVIDRVRIAVGIGRPLEGTQNNRRADINTQADIHRAPGATPTV